MRLDKYLKISRVIKRRSVANEICSSGRVLKNGKVAKPGAEIECGDILEIMFGNGVTRIQVRSVRDIVRKELASEMYEILEGEEIE